MLTLDEPKGMSPTAERVARKELDRVFRIATACGIPGEFIASLRAHANGQWPHERIDVQFTVGWHQSAAADMFDGRHCSLMKDEQFADYVSFAVRSCCHKLLDEVMRQESGGS